MFFSEVTKKFHSLALYFILFSQAFSLNSPSLSKIVSARMLQGFCPSDSTNAMTSRWFFQPSSDTHTHTHTHTHTPHTHTHTHRHTHTERVTNTHTHTHTPTEVHTHTHAHTHTEL